MEWEKFWYGLRIHPGPPYAFAFTGLFIVAAASGGGSRIQYAMALVASALMWLLVISTAMGVARANWPPEGRHAGVEE